MNNVILFSIYVFVGFFIALADKNAFVLYVTVLPLNYVFLKIALRKKMLAYSFFMLLVFLGMGIDPVCFFLRKNHILASRVVIRNFDFTLSSYFNAYSYFLVYTIAIILVVGFFYKKKYRGVVTGYISNQFKKIAYEKQYIKNADIYIYIIVILSIILTIWMYVNTIGMIGLKNGTQLPYHLNGILYYFRKGGITLILLLLYFKSKNKVGPLIAILIYAPIVGVTASSRTLPALLLIPLGVLDMYKGQKIRAIFLFVFSIICYGFITASRTYTLAAITVEIGISDVLQASYMDYISSWDPEAILYMLAEITDRLGGSRMMVLTDQFNLTTFKDLIYIYIGGSINDVVDVPGTIMGITFNSDYAMGTGLQLTGTVSLLTNHNYYYSFIQGVLTAIILISIDKLCRSIIKKKCNLYLQFVVVTTSIYIVYVLWTAQFIDVYLYMILVMLINVFIGHSYRKVKGAKRIV